MGLTKEPARLTAVIGGRSGRVCLIGFLVAAMLGAFVLVRARDAAGVPDFQAERVNRGLAQLMGADGRIHLPNEPVGESLASTAYAGSLARQVGEAWPKVENATRLTPTSGDLGMAVWDAYYSSLVRNDPVAPRTGWSRFTNPDGTYSEPPNRRTSDRPYVLLTTWAALSAGAEAPPGLRDTLLATLAGCKEREYVLAHVVETLELALGRSDLLARKALARCLVVKKTATAAVAPPSDDLTLLDLTGRAIALNLGGWPSPAQKVDYREMLRPTPQIGGDPWRAWQSMRGFVAAGGKVHDYRPAIQQWKKLQNAGVMPEISAHAPSTEVDLLATLTADLAPGPWRHPEKSAIRSLPENASTNHWEDADWVMWGRLAKAAEVQLDQPMSAKVRDAATRCLAQPVTAATMRVQWHCRELLSEFGAPLPKPSSALLRGLKSTEAVEMAALYDFDPGLATVKNAVSAVAQDARRLPTFVVAQALLLAERGAADTSLRKKLGNTIDKAQLSSALYSAGPGELQPDPYATYWVARADTAAN